MLCQLSTVMFLTTQDGEHFPVRACISFLSQCRKFWLLGLTSDFSVDDSLARWF